MGTGKHGNIDPKYNRGLPVPDAIKKIRGTYKEKNANLAARKLGADSAKDLMQHLEIPEELFNAPDTLNEYGRDEWNAFIKPLMQARVIALSDLRVAEMYCDAWGAYQFAKQQMDGIPSIKYGEYALKLMSQMGLTPISRHKVVLLSKAGQKPVAADEWSAILNSEDDDDA